MPRLDLRICGARNLPNNQTFGKIDPYCTVALEGKQWKTNVIDNTTEPEWNEVFKFNVADDDSSRIHFVVWDKNVVSDDYLGEYYMSISGLDRGVVDDKWLLLKNCKGNAELHVRLMAVDFGDAPEPETPPQPQYRPMPQGYQPPAENAQHYRPPPQQYQQPPQQQYQQPPQQQYQQPPQQQYQQQTGIEQFYGQPVFLLNCEHNNLLRGHPGGDGACVDTQASDRRGDWEKMTIEPVGPGKVSIRTIHGTWIRAHPDGHLDQAPRVEAYESWEVRPIGNGQFNLCSFHNKFLNSSPGGEGCKVDTTDVASTWERWTIQPAY